MRNCGSSWQVAALEAPNNALSLLFCGTDAALRTGTIFVLGACLILIAPVFL